MTVSEEWVYGGAGDELYSSAFGDTDLLPVSGTVLVTDGGRVTGADGRPSDDFFNDRVWARIVEVTHSTPPEKVFELVVGDEPDLNGG
jgi:hypothetical protein